jgi:hypothetical protein
VRETPALRATAAKDTGLRLRCSPVDRIGDAAEHGVSSSSPGGNRRGRTRCRSYRAGSSSAAPTAGTSTAASDTTVVSANTQFITPSRNIRCVFSPDPAGVRCDITSGSTSYTAPPKPANCEFDWGQSFDVNGQGAGHLICISDAVPGNRVLEYGHAFKSGSYLCTSTQAALRCENTDTKHGFTLARSRYTLF